MAREARKRNTGKAARESAQKVDANDVKVVSYRGKHGLCYGLLQLVLNVVTFHYMYWWAVGVGFLVLLHLWGPLGDMIAVLLIMAYLPSYFSRDATALGRPWPWLRKLSAWTVVSNYLGIKVTRTRKLDPSRNYVFGFHPHGIMILSRVSVYGGTFEKLFPGIDFRVLGATPIFWLPGCREISLYMGAVDAGKRTAERVLREGISVMVYPGGSKEIFSTNAHSKDTVLVLKKRFGFIKLAIKHGSPLVPVFVFGEKRLFHMINLPKALQRFCLKRLKIPLLLFWGRLMTLIPKGGPMSVVYGAPLETPHDPEPSDDLVREVHAKYMAAVEKLFNDHKADHGYGDDEKLVIV